MSRHHLSKPTTALVAGAAILSAVAAVQPARAQTAATVTVTAGTTIATIPATAFGLNTAVWDSNLMNASIPSLLTGVGTSALRYPGGSTSDTYNWQTNSIVPGQNSYAFNFNTFDNFIKLAKSVGAAPILTVNYGSNAAGNGGNTPAAAAAWVQYSNITKGYGVKYWEIGNEIYGNGAYGGQWETDLHAAHDPTTYGRNVAQFVAAMKAVDPTIKVGVVLAAPGNWPDGVAPDWNSNVLAQCGSVVDFVIVHWYPQNPGQESDSGLLAAPQKGFGGSPGIAAMVAKLKTLVNTYGGAAAASKQIVVTEENSVSSNTGKQTLSIVNAMFNADALLTWLENGVANVDTWALHNSASSGNTSSSLYGNATYGDYGVLSAGSPGEPAADTPFPTYYGLKMVSTLGKPGDALVSATSTNPLLSVHAVKQAGGNLAVLLVNKDPTNTTTATIAVPGFTPAGSATVYSYGKTSTAVTSSGLTGVGSTFQVPAGPYSLTSVVLTPSAAAAPPAAPSFAISDNPASVTVVQGASAATTVSVTPKGGFTGNVLLEVSGLPNDLVAHSDIATVGSAAGATATVTFTADPGSVVGSRIVTITGSNGLGGSLSATTAVTVNVVAAPGTTPPPPATTPSFSLSDSVGALTLAPGGSGKASISVVPANGFNSAVALTLSGLPSGVSGSFSPPVTLGSSTLTLSAGSAATAGTANVTITGTTGTGSKSITLPVTITAATPAPNPAPGGAGPASFVGKIASSGPYFDEEDVALTTTTPITAMTLTISVAPTNVKYNGLYNTYGGSGIVQQGAAGTGALTYSFTSIPGATIRPGSYTFAAQMNGNGSVHPMTGDTWTVTYTAGGATYTQSGVY